MFDVVDRYHQLEDLRRSIAMLRPGADALDREKAMALLREVQGLERRLRRFQDGLEALL